MPRDDVYLIDVLEAAKLAVFYLKGKSLEEFLNDIEKQDAVIRRLEIIGEAARRISEAKRESRPDIPWKKIIGLRNVLIHEYDDVDMTSIWNTVKNWLPGLIDTLERKI